MQFTFITGQPQRPGCFYPHDSRPLGSWRVSARCYMPEKKRRHIEREFGVPIAGEILDPSLWTQTALKKLPPGRLDWQALFGRQAPVVLDLGCGNGRFLLGSAVWRPDHD